MGPLLVQISKISVFKGVGGERGGRRTPATREPGGETKKTTDMFIFGGSEKMQDCTQFKAA